MIDSLPKEADILASDNSTMGSEAAVPFDLYVSAVEDLAEAALSSTLSQEHTLPLSDLLDGQAAATLRETIPLPVRRARGAFFSSSGLRISALTSWPDGLDSGDRFLDPAVGAGDLLIEVARHLPVDQDLTQTLRRWGLLLHGRDVESAFVRLAKARLALLAVSRGRDREHRNQRPSGRPAAGDHGRRRSRPPQRRVLRWAHRHEPAVHIRTRTQWCGMGKRAYEHGRDFLGRSG